MQSGDNRNNLGRNNKGREWGSRRQTDSTIGKGLMGVGEVSVCASVQNMRGGGGGGGTTHKPNWTLCEQLIRS